MDRRTFLIYVMCINLANKFGQSVHKLRIVKDSVGRWYL
jgi:hypothetical protein